MGNICINNILEDNYFVFTQFEGWTIYQTNAKRFALLTYSNQIVYCILYLTDYQLKTRGTSVRKVKYFAPRENNICYLLLSKYKLSYIEQFLRRPVRVKEFVHAYLELKKKWTVAKLNIRYKYQHRNLKRVLYSISKRWTDKHFDKSPVEIAHKSSCEFTLVFNCYTFLSPIGSNPPVFNWTTMQLELINFTRAYLQELCEMH